MFCNDYWSYLYDSGIPFFGLFFLSLPPLIQLGPYNRGCIAASRQPNFYLLRRLAAAAIYNIQQFDPSLYFMVKVPINKSFRKLECKNQKNQKLLPFSPEGKSRNKSINKNAKVFTIVLNQMICTSRQINFEVITYVQQKTCECCLLCSSVI